jgi:outer membrane protein TolC
MESYCLADKGKFLRWAAGAALAAMTATTLATAQAPSQSGASSPGTPFQPAQQATSSSSYQGSVVDEKATADVLQLTLDDAIQRGLKHNLGLILTGQNQQSAGGQRLQELQGLLPTVDGSFKAAVAETNLQAEGLRIPGFPAIIGPYGYQDVRGTLNWSLLNITSLKNYLAAKHNFAGTQLSIQDARDMVVLTVGNAYLTCIADAALIDSDQAQVDTSKVSLDEAVANHQAGTSPLLDELRARVDYQTQQQTLISAQNQYEKDKIALARAIGLSLDQKFTLTDQAPFAALDQIDLNALINQAEGARSDLKALGEQVESAKESKSAATAERFPTIDFEGDYGAIGVNMLHSHGTGDATGTLTVPLFEEGKLRGDSRIAQSALDQKKAQLSDLQGQISADVRDAILDIQSAQQRVSVAESNAHVAAEALSEAQQRYAAGVSDNLAVSQAQQSVAQANNQYVSSLYEHNVAKLSLARALGLADRNYKQYVGGK